MEGIQRRILIKFKSKRIIEVCMFSSIFVLDSGIIDFKEIISG
jgi:hypothetical protein